MPIPGSDWSLKQGFGEIARANISLFFPLYTVNCKQMQTHYITF